MIIDCTESSQIKSTEGLLNSFTLNIPSNSLNKSLASNSEYSKFKVPASICERSKISFIKRNKRVERDEDTIRQDVEENEFEDVENESGVKGEAENENYESVPAEFEEKRENGLEVLEEVCPLSARMVVNQVSMKMEQERINKLINDVKKYIETQGI